MNFTTKQIDFIARKLAVKYFDTELNIPVTINNRMDGHTLGRFMYNEIFHEPRRIFISGRANQYRSPVAVIDTLLHELTHWYCFINRQDFSDGDEYFENQLRRVGASSTRTKAFAGDKYELKCFACKNILGTVNSRRQMAKYLRGYSQGKYRIKHYPSPCCKAQIIEGDVHVIEDVYKPTEKMQAVYDFAMECLDKQGDSVRVVNKKESGVKSVASQSGTIVEDEIIVPGPRGVTNKQMIPAIEKCVMANDKESITKLKEQYPDVFESSRKYVKKSLQFRFYQLID